MSSSLPSDLSSFSMLDLFRAEADNQKAVLSDGLLGLEKAATPNQLEALMRAAHSLKGAARIVGLDAAVRVAHAMEDAFVAAQRSPCPSLKNRSPGCWTGKTCRRNTGGRPHSPRCSWT